MHRGGRTIKVLQFAHTPSAKTTQIRKLTLCFPVFPH